jgi:hypothetical protein
MASEVDIAYGSPLSREPGRKTGRIADYHREVDRHEEHEEYIAWLIGGQERLHSAIRSVASSVRWLST